jgi:hypothetical protein
MRREYVLVSTNPSTGSLMWLSNSPKNGGGRILALRPNYLNEGVELGKNHYEAAL